MAVHVGDNRERQSPPDSGFSDVLRIVRAAIRDEIGGVHSVPIPGRHHDVIKQMRDAGYTGRVRGDMQGFVLSDGRFVMRKAAEALAKKNGQLGQANMIASTLTSEDLW